MYINTIALLIVYGIYADLAIFFEAALLIALMGFTSTVLCKYLLRGDITSNRGQTHARGHHRLLPRHRRRFTPIGSIGLARLPDLFTRLHGPTKATTGVGSILIAFPVYFSARGPARACTNCSSPCSRSSPPR